MRCAVVVAHPDDCVIFAWPLMRNLKAHEWTVIYLTYCESDARAQEIKKFWSQYQVQTVFLGYTDDYRDLETNTLSFDSAQAVQDVIKQVNLYDLVVTHNADGDYGHIHHKFVNACVSSTAVPQIYFAGVENNNIEIIADENYDLDQLPLHREVIEDFRDRHIGRYWITEQAVETLGWAH